MTIPWLPDVLEDAGLRVVVVAGYRSNGRPGDFDPVGVLIHHTGATSSRERPHPAAKTLVNGRPDLPGPLAQWSPGWDGTVLIPSIGRANHAGKARAAGPVDAGDGNEEYVGCEVDYNGSQRMGPAQYEATVLGTAAIIKHLRRDERHVQRHEDTSVTGKWDAGGYTTLQLQQAVREALQLAGKPKPAQHTSGDADGGPRGPWPFGPNHKLGFNPADYPTWHDGQRPGERAAIAQWQREIYMPDVTGRWTATNNAEMVRRTRTWQKAVGLLPTGHPGMAEWATGLKR